MRFQSIRTARFFLPGLLLSLVTILPPLAVNRAVHPNALYPSAVSEALKSPEPIARLAATVAGNARTNLELVHLLTLEGLHRVAPQLRHGPHVFHGARP